ncbi:MAG: hypothetical protein V1867_02025 [Candidatus Falkowbacteria bacterium]
MSVRGNNLKPIYTMHSIEGFAMSLIGIFIPIYLLTLGYAISDLFVFFMIHYALLPVFGFLAIRIAGRIGLQKTIMTRFPFLFAYLILLFMLKTKDIPLGLIAVFMSLNSALYWIPLHILFARNTDKKEAGSATGKLFALPQIASLAGPLLGGFIAATFGFKALIGTVCAFLLLSILPLLIGGPRKSHFGFIGRMLALPQLGGAAHAAHHALVEALPHKPDFRFEFSRGWELLKKHPKYFFAEIFDNIGEETEAIIWPIFVYLNLLNVAAVGFLGTFLSLGSILITILAGRLTDKHGWKKIMRVGAVFLALLWTARYFAESEAVFYALSILAGMFTVLFLLPYTSRVYSLADKKSIDEFFVFREIPVAIGRIALLAAALLFVDNLNALFPIAGAAYLYFLFL